MAIFEDRKKVVRFVLGFSFFLSGFSALTYEVVWMRKLNLIFGSTTFAVSTILSTFMAGLALGSFFGGRFVDRWNKPLPIYASLETGLGIFGLLSPLLLTAIGYFYQALFTNVFIPFYLSALIKFFLSFLCLLLPATLMGATLPVLSKYYIYLYHQKNSGYNVGLLYGLNTFGAVAGVISSGFFLLPRIGANQTIYIAAMINLTVAVICYLLILFTKSLEFRPQEKNIPASNLPNNTTLHSRLLLIIYIIFGISGFAAMVYEIAWTRILTLILGPSTYAFSTMLATFLIGLAIGSLLISPFVANLKTKILFLGIVELFIGISVLLTIFLFNELPFLFLSIYKFASHSPALLLLLKFLLAAAVMFPPTFLMGIAFPLIIELCSSNLQRIGKTVGDLYSINTAGAIIGSFAGGFILIPLIGIQYSLIAVITLNISAGIILILYSEFKPLKYRVIVSSSAALFALFLIVIVPPWNSLLMTMGVYKYAPDFIRVDKKQFKDFIKNIDLLFYKEGLTATISVRKEQEGLSLQIDGKTDASDSLDLPTQLLLGHLPLLFAESPQKVMVIGLGSGVTLGAVERYPVKNIGCLEIEPAVIEASRYFNKANNLALEDERLKIIVDDARNYMSTSTEIWDIMISEPSNPWISGCSALFTQEFFKLAEKKLAPQGIFCQWLQLYGMSKEDLKSIIGTFQSVFPNVLIFRIYNTSDLILLGSNDKIEIDIDKLSRRFQNLEITNDLQRINIKDIYDLLAHYYLGGEDVKNLVKGVPLNTDDNGLIEFSTPQNLFVDLEIEHEKELKKHRRHYLSLLKNYGDNNQAKSLFFLKLADVCSKNDIDEALNIYKISLKLDPSNVEAYLHLALIYEKSNNFEKCIDQYRQAVKIKPDYIETYEQWGNSYAQRKMFDKAIEVFLKIAKLNPNDANNYYNIGVCFDAQTLTDEAVENYKKALELDPDLVTARNNLGTIYYEIGEMDKAAEEFKKVLEIKPDKVETVINLGYLYEQMENFDLAIVYFERALNMKPPVAEAIKIRRLLNQLQNKQQK